MSAVDGKERLVEWLYSNPQGASRKTLAVWLGRSEAALDHLILRAERQGLIARRHHKGAKAVTVYHIQHAPEEEPAPHKQPVMTRIAGKAPSAKPDPDAEGEITADTVVTVCPGFEDRRFEVKEFQPYFSKMKPGRYYPQDSAIARAYGAK